MGTIVWSSSHTKTCTAQVFICASLHGTARPLMVSSSCASDPLTTCSPLDTGMHTICTQYEHNMHTVSVHTICVHCVCTMRAHCKQAVEEGLTDAPPQLCHVHNLQCVVHIFWCKEWIVWRISTPDKSKKHIYKMQCLSLTGRWQW